MAARCLIVSFAVICAAAACRAAPDTNYDEEKVGQYTLPDPLVSLDGQPVRDAETWLNKRRPEIVRLFEENMHGRSPGRPEGMTFGVFDNEPHALGGKAIRKQVEINFLGKADGPKMNLLIYLPADAPKPVPLFLCLQFNGNHRAYNDPAIRISETWDNKAKEKQLEPDSTRGTGKQLAIDKALARGYGIAAIYYCDVEPDFIGAMQYGIRPYFFNNGQSEPSSDDWGAIGAWAWGASRALDYLETDKDVDAKRVFMLGQSRLGKTALWAGAHDTRFAMVVAANSGEGGASLSRRNYGETVKDINQRFPYWFCANYLKFGDHVDQLPVDSHMLLALIAPRPVFLSTGSEDRWSDPKGEFLAAAAAGPVYRMLGKDDLGTDAMPPLDKPIMHTIGYVCHTGKHEITPADWDCYFDFADMHLKPMR
jgi:hypothetical protein